MTVNSPVPFDALAGVFSYPDEGYDEHVQACAAALAEASGGAAACMAAFASEVAGLGLEQLEELFTRTFDLNPACTLDLGWHLHGEAYERGRFLVTVRGLLREHGIVESSELPDHLSHVLPLLGRLAPEVAAQLAQSAVVPALATMAQALESTANPYRHALAAVRVLVSEVVIERGAEVCHE